MEVLERHGVPIVVVPPPGWEQRVAAARQAPLSDLAEQLGVHYVTASKARLHWSDERLLAALLQPSGAGCR